MKYILETMITSNSQSSFLVFNTPGHVNLIFFAGFQHLFSMAVKDQVQPYCTYSKEFCGSSGHENISVFSKFWHENSSSSEVPLYLPHQTETTIFLSPHDTRRGIRLECETTPPGCRRLHTIRRALLHVLHLLCFRHHNNGVFRWFWISYVRWYGINRNGYGHVLPIWANAVTTRF